MSDIQPPAQAYPPAAQPHPSGEQPYAGMGGHPAGGYPAAGYPMAPQPFAPKRSNGLAVAALVLGILALLGSWIPVLNVISILMAVIGAALAIAGLVRASKVGSGKGMAITALILNVLAVAFSVLINSLVIGAVDEVVEESTRTTVETPASGQGKAEGDEVDAELGTSRSNPAPLGSGVKGDDWTVTVNSVTTIEQDSIGSKAAAGSVLLLVNVTAAYDGDDEQGESAWSTVKYVSPDGVTIGSLDGSTMFLPENSFDTLTTLFKGGKTTGDEIIEVPAKDWRSGVLAVSPGMFSDDTFISLK